MLMSRVYGVLYMSCNVFTTYVSVEGRITITSTGEMYRYAAQFLFSTPLNALTAATILIPDADATPAVTPVDDPIAPAVPIPAAAAVAALMFTPVPDATPIPAEAAVTALVLAPVPDDTPMPPEVAVAALMFTPVPVATPIPAEAAAAC
jgi:hypothetical protein